MKPGISPLNTESLNGTPVPASVPQPIQAGRAFRWRDRVTVDSVDVSAQVSGALEIDRERGAAGIADFALYMAVDPIPLEWVGRTVSIDYLSTAAGITTEVRGFTGRIESTRWDALSRLLFCECSDQLQQQVEALSVAEVDALTPAYWSADVFEPAEGRSRWDYAQERLSSLRASLDISAAGDLRLTSWYAGAVNYEFGADTTVYQSIEVGYADLSTLTNVVEIEADYRIQRLRQRTVAYDWSHPGAAGFAGIQGFCAWRSESTELPDVAMVTSAVESSGQALMSATYNRVPLTAPDPCGTGVAWVNTYQDLLLGASFRAGRRWVQSVTEQYKLRVEASASIADVGEVIARDGAAAEVETRQADGWESSLSTPSPGAAELGAADGHIDDRAEARRQLLLRCLLNQAAAKIVQAHTATVLSWDVPTSMVMGLDLTHTLMLDDQGVRGLGRCCRISHRWDKLTGSAMTTVSIAVMRGGGSTNDSLDPPVYPVEALPDPGGESPGGGLPTQLGLRNESPIYSDALDGFAGNYDENDADINAALEAFPRRFTLTAPEISAAERDELVVPITGTYRISIPNDLLEL